MLYGPNTNLGHNSILVMIEAQVGYIIDAIRQMDARGVRCLDVKREVMDEYNRGLQRDLAKSVWAADKQSWYKLAERHHHQQLAAQHDPLSQAAAQRRPHGLRHRRMRRGPEHGPGPSFMPRAR